MQSIGNNRNEDGSNENDVRVNGEFPLHGTVRHVCIGKISEYFIQWYGFGPDVDNAEPASNILQHFTARYWSRMNRKRQRNDGTSVTELHSTTKRLMGYSRPSGTERNEVVDKKRDLRLERCTKSNELQYQQTEEPKKYEESNYTTIT